MSNKENRSKSLSVYLRELCNIRKMLLCKWHTFWMAPWLIYCFIAILFYIERKWLLMRNLATALPLKPKLSGKFSVSMLLMEVPKRWNIAEFPKLSIKLKKNKTLYEAQSPLQEAIQTPPGKSFLGKDTEIYRHLLSQCFENAVLRHLEMVQCKFFFWHKLETCLLENL